jgi:hypothetical protein
MGKIRLPWVWAFLDPEMSLNEAAVLGFYGELPSTSIKVAGPALGLARNTVRSCIRILHLCGYLRTPHSPPELAPEAWHLLKDRASHSNDHPGYCKFKRILYPPPEINQPATLAILGRSFLDHGNGTVHGRRCNLIKDLRITQRTYFRATQKLLDYALTLGGVNYVTHRFNRVTQRGSIASPIWGQLCHPIQEDQEESKKKAPSARGTPYQSTPPPLRRPPDWSDERWARAVEEQARVERRTS